MTVYCDNTCCKNNKDDICCSQLDIHIETRIGEPICDSYEAKDDDIAP